MYVDKELDYYADTQEVGRCRIRRSNSKPGDPAWLWNQRQTS